MNLKYLLFPSIALSFTSHMMADQDDLFISNETISEILIEQAITSPINQDGFNQKPLDIFSDDSNVSSSIQDVLNQSPSEMLGATENIWYLYGTFSSTPNPVMAAFNGTTMYVDNGGGYGYPFPGSNLAVFDISNPLNPVFKGSLSSPQNGLRINSINLGTSGGSTIAYVTTSYYNTNGPCYLNTYDVSVPGTASYLGSSNILNGYSLRPDSYGGNQAFALSGTLGLLAINNNDTAFIAYYDLSNPSSPVLNGTVQANPAGSNGVNTILCSGTTAYVLTNNPVSLALFNTSSGSPSFLGSISLGTLSGNSENTMLLNGTTIYANEKQDALISVVQVGPGTATFVGNLANNYYSGPMSLSGSTLYTAGSNHITLENEISYFNASIPGKLTLLGNVNCPISPSYISSSGTTTMFGAYDTVAMYDTTNPHPIFIGTASTDQSGYIGYLPGTVGYALNGNDHIAIIAYGIPPVPPTPPAPPLNIGGNGGSMYSAGKEISGNCPQDTQDYIDFNNNLPSDQQPAGWSQAAPVFKILQFTQEKLDLLLQKELDYTLYCKRVGTTPYLIVGYDNLNQQTFRSYNGYNTDNFYQMFGFTHNFNKFKGLVGMGVAESYVKTRPLPGRASYTTVYGTLGLSHFTNHFKFGLKSLFGYSFIEASRHMNLWGHTPKTSHGSWNISFDGRVSYTFNAKKIDIMPYESLAYLYGHENQYHEHGGLGANLSVKGENISVIRNALGVSLTMPNDVFSQFFIDAAWVYDHYFNTNKYHTAFLGTDVYTTVQQTIPTQNYGRINTGIMGSHNNWDWKVSYNGLYGKRLTDNGVSIKTSYRF
jgi:hypothetical protein